MERTLYQRHLSCLRFQIFGVEAHSFLPDDQSDGRNLARHSETGHRRLRPFGDQSIVKIMYGPSTATGPRRRTFENVLEIAIAVSIEPTKLHGFLGTA